MGRPPGAKQLELIPRSKNPLLVLDSNHRLVLLTDALDWLELEAKAQDIRRKKLKSRAGRPPNLRALLGAVIFMSMRRVPYRDAEDLLRHYAPARYLCDLTESTWTPDFTTIHNFTKLMGPLGLAELNEMAVKMAVEQGFADPGSLVADTTVQEAHMSYPTEVGLLDKLLGVVDTLVPQIEYWLESGYVAKKKIVNLAMPLLRSIPRGKVGKDVEFGIKWGISRVGGGFVFGSADAAHGNFNDQKYVRRSVEHHTKLFGAVPDAFAFDRGGWSPANNDYLGAVGVRHNGIFPQGRAPWRVDGKVKQRLVKQRARIEGDIGAIKSARYGFNRPAARSEAMMVACGQRAMLGYNLNKLVRMLGQRAELAITG